MRYFYQDGTSPTLGPYTRDELRQLHLSGIIRQETLVQAEGSETAIAFRDLWTQWQAEGEAARRARETFVRRQAGRDSRDAPPELVLPFKEFREFNWLNNKRLIAIAAVGLVPLIVLATFPTMQTAFWAMAIYFSALWALFFYYVFPTPGVRVSTAALAFFATGVFSTSFLVIVYALPPLSWLERLDPTQNSYVSMLAYVFGVALPEELCKAVTLFVLLKKSDPLPPQLMVFYGLMSGLGFGIYEGVDYQLGRNFRYAVGGGEYYLLNLVRITTLPFLHAMWTGIAGYFIGFAGLYPRQQRRLILIGIAVPMFLHGLYNTFSSNIIGLGFALLTVLALNVYLARSVEFEESLIERNLAKMP